MNFIKNNFIKILFFVSVIIIALLFIGFNFYSESIISNYTKKIIEKNTDYIFEVDFCDLSYTNGLYYKNIVVKENQDKIISIKDLYLEFDLFSLLFSNKSIENLYISDALIALNNIKPNNTKRNLNNFTINNLNITNLKIINDENVVNINSNLFLQSNNGRIDMNINNLILNNYILKDIDIVSLNSFISISSDRIEFIFKPLLSELI